MGPVKSVLLARSPLRIVMVCFLLGIVWIYFSDQLVLRIFREPDMITNIQTLKGWLAVIFGCFVLYFLIGATNNMFYSREKEVLLSEVHHRVKNNLALISALFDLQASYTDNKEVQQILSDSRMRVKSLAMVYETFPGSEECVNMKFGDYLNQLINYISDTLHPQNEKIRIRKQISDVRLNINQAVPFGLICNELLTNACIHAFKGVEEPEIAVNLLEKDSHIHLSIVDNGVGLPDRSYYDDPSTLGFTIVKSLIDQIDAEMEITSDQSGTRYVITFNKLQVKGPSSSLAIG